jgi:hypothetical protein
MPKVERTALQEANTKSSSHADNSGSTLSKFDMPQTQQFLNPQHRRTAQRGAGNDAVGPSQERRHCIALSRDGAECDGLPPRLGHELCPPHHQEYKELYSQYKSAEEHYNQLVEPEGGLKLGEAKEKIALGRKTLDLRNQVNRRFFSQQARNRGHIRWILKLEDEIRALEGSLLKSDDDHGKLCDFGISKKLKSSDEVTGTQLGSPHYAAPEILNGEAYAFPSDIWSLGITVLDMFRLSPPKLESWRIAGPAGSA